MSTWNGVVGTKKSCQQKKCICGKDRYAEEVKEELRAEGNFVDFHIGVHEKHFVQVLNGC
jgi:hypothetical protein